MHKKKRLCQKWNVVIGVLCFFAAFSGVAATNDLPAIIPWPEKIQSSSGVFVLEPETKVCSDSASTITRKYLVWRLEKATGFKIKKGFISKRGGFPCGILLTTNLTGQDLGAEGYVLDVTPGKIVINARTQTGMFYGVQTLLQLMPPEVYADSVKTSVSWQIPCTHIEDSPRFKWRGFMLDVSRHFFDKEEVEQLLDVMAIYKLNIFHWHLVDNQGWRIEIKKYPRLTEKGAWRKDIGFEINPTVSRAYRKDGCYGGYYTQEDIREVVAYAKARHITIVPEIEMPGHSQAALSAYPEFSCSGAGVYCAGNDRTFLFLEDVLSEVFALFPGKYIHVGGDEVPKDFWRACPKCQNRIKENGLHNEEELQSYFIQRIEKFVNAHGRTLVGWSEIGQGGLAKSAVLMDWKGGGLDAAMSGHDVVMTPNASCYFDHYQSLDYATEPVAIGCYTPLKAVYDFDPVPPQLKVEYWSHVLGGQACVWSEYIASRSYLEYMSFPRLCALAEVVWSPKDMRDWRSFTSRLSANERRFDVLGINYRRERSIQIGEWTASKVSVNGTILEWDITPILAHPDRSHLVLDDVLRPSTEGLLAEPGKCHVVFDQQSGDTLKISRVDILKDGHVIASDVHDGLAGVDPRDLISRDVAYILSVPYCMSGAHYTVRAHVASATPNGSTGIVYCEVRGNH